MSYNLKTDNGLDYFDRDICLTTTDATSTVIDVVNTETDCGCAVFVKLFARRSSGTGDGADGDVGLWKSEISIREVSGTLTIVGSNSITPIKDNAAWDFTWAVNGTILDLKVQGDVDNTIDWFGEVEILMIR